MENFTPQTSEKSSDGRISNSSATARSRRSLSGIGGVETGEDAAQLILAGANSVQVCTGVMKFGYELIRPLCEELPAFMDKHNFESLDDFRGHSLVYFTTHAELVRIQKARKAAQRVPEQGRFIKADGDWNGDRFVEQSAALSR